MRVLLFVLLCIQCFGGEIPWERDKVIEENFQLTTNSILGFKSQGINVTEFNFDGSIRTIYEPTAGRGVAKAGYIESEDLVILLTHDIKNKSYHIEAFNRKKQASPRGKVTRLRSVGEVFLMDQSGQKLDSYFESIVCSGDDTFAHFQNNPDALKALLDKAPLSEELPKKANVLAQVHLERGDESAYILRLDQPGFDAVEPFESKDELTRRWVVSDGYQVKIVNQQVPLIKTFEFSNQKQRLGYEEKLNSRKSPRLANWQMSYKEPSGLSRKDYEIWFTSFSKNVGFYPMGRDYVLGYTSPSETHPYFTEGEYRADRELFDLHLLLLDGDGQVSSEPVSFPGGIFLGVHGEQAMLLVPHPEGGKYQIKQISF